MSTATQDNFLTPKLVVGDMIGERFRIESFIGSDIAGELYLALDSQAKRTVLLRLFLASFFPDESAQKKLRAQVKKAAKLSDTNLAALYGMGKFEDTLYLAGEFAKGLSLSDHVKKRKSTNTFFPLMGLQKAFSPLLRVLSHIHSQNIVHGFLSTRWVQVGEQGRILLRGLGFFSYLVLQKEFRAAVQKSGKYVLAPELEQETPSLGPQTDVWHLGALFYELLTNQPISKTYIPPSSLRNDLPREFDGLVARCLSPDPQTRFANAEAISQAINPIFARMAQAKAAIAPGLPVAKQTETDTERWLIQKNGLDYGPYTGRQVKKQLEDEEITEETLVLDCETSVRKPIADQDYFREFVEDWRQNTAKRDALKESASVEKSVQRAGKLRAFQFLVGVILLLALVLGYYFLVPRVRDQGEEYPLLAVQMVPVLEDDLLWVPKKDRVPKPRISPRYFARGKKSKTSSGGGNEGLDSDYDDSDAMILDFDDPEDIGSRASKLSRSDLEKGMNQIHSRLTRCAREEKRRSGASVFSVRFIVTKAGRARGIRLAGESGSALQKCVKVAVSKARFPKTSSETPGNYSFGF